MRQAQSCLQMQAHKKYWQNEVLQVFTVVKLTYEESQYVILDIATIKTITILKS